MEVFTPRSVPQDASDRLPPASSPRERTTGDADRNRNVRGFSPDYEPSPKAVIRAVDPDSTEHLASPKLQGEHRIETPSRDPQTAPCRLLVPAGQQRQ